MVKYINFSPKPRGFLACLRYFLCARLILFNSESTKPRLKKFSLRFILATIWCRSYWVCNSSSSKLNYANKFFATLKASCQIKLTPTGDARHVALAYFGIGCGAVREKYRF